MKMLDKDYRELKTAINKVLRQYPTVRSDYAKAKHSATRLRFDLYYKAQDLGHIARDYTNRLRKYLNDSHIETALKKILKESKLGRKNPGHARKNAPMPGKNLRIKLGRGVVEADYVYDEDGDYYDFYLDNTHLNEGEPWWVDEQGIPTRAALERIYGRKNPGHARNNPHLSHSMLKTHTVLGEQVDTYLTRSRKGYNAFIVRDDFELPATYSTRSGAVSGARAYLKKSKRKNPSKKKARRNYADVRPVRKKSKSDKLTPAKRRKLPKSDFGLPSKAPGVGSYPIPDIKHAAAAVAYSTAAVNSGALSKANQDKIFMRILAKFPQAAKWPSMKKWAR